MNKGPHTRRRRLRPEELDLWHEVLRTVTPMPGVEFDVPATQPISSPPALTVPLALAAEVNAKGKPDPKSKLLPLAPLERRVRQKLSRGRLDVDASIDLHGMRQDEAHARLRQFLHRCQADNARLVLVVTGKGRSSRVSESGHDEVGVLRRNVPEWLRAADLRRIVVSVESATATHGGAGALYVRLRRADRGRI